MVRDYYFYGQKMKYNLNKKLEEAFEFKQLANEKTK
jgi:hypothetical protein